MSTDFQLLHLNVTIYLQVLEKYKYILILNTSFDRNLFVLRIISTCVPYGKVHNCMCMHDLNLEIYLVI